MFNLMAASVCAVLDHFTWCPWRWSLLWPKGEEVFQVWPYAKGNDERGGKVRNSLSGDTHRQHSRPSRQLQSCCNFFGCRLCRLASHLAHTHRWPLNLNFWQMYGIACVEDTSAVCMHTCCSICWFGLVIYAEGILGCECRRNEGFVIGIAKSAEHLVARPVCGGNCFSSLVSSLSSMQCLCVWECACVEKRC